MIDTNLGSGGWERICESRSLRWREYVPKGKGWIFFAKVGSAIIAI